LLLLVTLQLTLNPSFSLPYSIIKKYSAFVAFPVKVNGETVNTVQAIWAMEKTAVTEEQYNDFYR
jgi:HSP90 family molecular chaperone